MTLEDFLRYLDGIDPLVILPVLLLPPLLTLFLGLFQKEGRAGDSSLAYIYTFLVYLVSIPGIFAFVLTAYSLFFLKENLLRVNLLVYFGPILSMILTLGLVRRRIGWDELPGVDRLFAFVMIIGLSFALALGIEKTRIWVFFGGSLVNLLIVALVCFLLLKLCLSILFKKGNDGSGDNLKKVKKDLERIKRKIRS